MNKAEHPAIHERYLDHPYALAGRIIDPITGNVSWQKKGLHLQRKDLEVLALLASNPSLVITRASFIAVVRDGNDLVGDRGVSDKNFSLPDPVGEPPQSHSLLLRLPL